MNPKTKIFFNGKLIRPKKYIRNNKGEFTLVKRSKMWLVVVALVAYGSVALFTSTSTVTYVNAEPVKPLDRTPEKIAKLKAETVNLISNCEVPGYKTGDAPIVLDTNAKMSIGPLMFQTATVQTYEKSLYGKTISKLESTQIALDESQAKSLAQDIIFKADAPNNWYTCSKKLGIEQRIKLIKELE